MSCNTLECIAVEAAGLGLEFVLQYQKKKICIATVEQGQGWTVLQYSGQPSHDTAGAGQQARAQGRAGRVGRRRGARLGVRGALGWAWQTWRTADKESGRRGARQAGRATGVVRGRQGARQGRALQAGTSARQARGRGAQQARGSRRAGSAGLARPGRWALGLGAQAGYGLCTRCTRPVFGPVRLRIFPESIFGHCS